MNVYYTLTLNSLFLCVHNPLSVYILRKKSTMSVTSVYAVVRMCALVISVLSKCTDLFIFNSLYTHIKIQHIGITVQIY